MREMSDAKPPIDAFVKWLISNLTSSFLLPLLNFPLPQSGSRLRVPSPCPTTHWHRSKQGKRAPSPPSTPLASFARGPRARGRQPAAATSVAQSVDCWVYCHCQSASGPAQLPQPGPTQVTLNCENIQTSVQSEVRGFGVRSLNGADRVCGVGQREWRISR